jgi:hypothetical protein
MEHKRARNSNNRHALPLHQKQIISLTLPEGHEDFQKEEVPKNEPISLEELRIANLSYDPTCFGCTHNFGKPNDNKKFASMTILWEEFATYKGKISDYALYEQLERVHYDLYIDPYKRMLAKEGEHIELPTAVSPWTSEQIKTHLTKHAIFLDFELHDDFVDLKELARVYKSNCAERDITRGGHIIPNNENTKVYLQVLNAKQNTLIKMQQQQQQNNTLKKL